MIARRLFSMLVAESETKGKQKRRERSNLASGERCSFLFDALGVGLLLVQTE